MRPRFCASFRSTSLFASIFLSFGPAVHADIFTWDGDAGTADWQTATNWNPDSGNADFNGSFSNRLNVNGSQKLEYTAAEGTTVYANTSDRGLVIGSPAGNTGTMEISGGSFSTLGSSAADVIGNGTGSSGTLTISGGTFIGTNAGTQLGLGGGPTSTLNVSSGTATLSSLVLNATTATVNLSGSGLLEVNSISRTGGSGSINFDGGTLRARTSTASFLTGLTAATVNAGGATVDSNNFNITIGQNLLGGAGSGGLTKTGSGTLTLTGTNTYTGLTTVNNGTLFLNTTGGGAIAGDIKLTSTATSRTYVRLQQSDQIAPASTLTLELANPAASSSNVYSEIALQGNSQTLAAINTIVASGIGSGSSIFIENRIFGDNGGGNGVLTINGAADSTWGSRVLVRDGHSGTLALIKDGSGTLTLGGANTYTGATTINGGTVKAGNAAALGATSTGTTINTGGTFDFNGIALNAETFNLAGGKLTNTGTTQLNAVNGAVTVTANSSIGGTTRWDFRSTGASLTVNNGTILIKEDGNTVASVARTVNNNGTIQIDAGVFAFHTAGSYAGSGNYVVNSGGELQLGGYGAASTVTLPNSITSNGGTLSSADATGSGGAPVFSGNISLASSTTTTLRADANGIVSGDLSGSGNLTKTGTGSFSLTGDNSSFSGATTVNAGILSLGHANALGASSSVSVASGATLRVDTPSSGSGRTVTINGSGAGFLGALQGTASSSVTWAGNVILGSNEARIGGGEGGTLAVTGVISDDGNGHSVLFSRAPNSTTLLNNVNTYTGDTLFYPNTSTVTLKMGVANAIDSSSRIRAGIGPAGGNAYFDLNGFNQNVRALVDDQNANLIVTNNGGSDAVLTLNESNASNSATFDGWIQDGTTHHTSLVKSGAGTQILSATNTYTGNTTITQGTLALAGDGSINQSAVIDLQSDGTLSIAGVSTSTIIGNSTAQTLKGTGTVDIGSKTLTLGGSGTLAPGASPGTLEFIASAGGKLDFAENSTIAFELGTLSDLIAFDSAGDWLSGSGNANLSLSLLGGFDYSNIYTVFQNVTTAGFSFANITGYDSGSYTANFTQSGNNYNLSFTLIPEPGTALLGSLATTMLLLRRRRTSPV